jgi:hypothetical protein
VKIAGALLLAAGVLAGYADGDQFDEVGCSVAQQPGGPSRKAHLGQSTDGTDKKAPDCGGGPGGGGNGAGGGGPPPCEVRAEKCTNQLLLELVAEMAGMRREVAGEMAGIRREVAAVREHVRDLRSAKERLAQMSADGVFAFTRKVDPTSFKVLCTILAEGDVAKAGRRLGIGDPMMRYHLRQWKERGGAYSVMLDLVRWRKKVGRNETVPLSEAVFQEKAETVDYPGLLSDVLDGLLSVTAHNWQELCDELAELIRPAVGGPG